MIATLLRVVLFLRFGGCMINIEVRKNRIKMNGHASTAPKGQYIACAAVSALTLTLVDALITLCGDPVSANVNSGNVNVEWQELSDGGKRLVDAWFLGMCRIADNYKCIEFI